LETAGTGAERKDAKCQVMKDLSHALTQVARWQERVDHYKERLDNLFQHERQANHDLERLFEVDDAPHSVVGRP
jgi:thiamine phosphate synthase YjbQ (UPF0047 family)